MTKAILKKEKCKPAPKTPVLYFVGFYDWYAKTPFISDSIIISFFNAMGKYRKIPNISPPNISPPND